MLPSVFKIFNRDKFVKHCIKSEINRNNEMHELIAIAHICRKLFFSYCSIK